MRKALAIILIMLALSGCDAWNVAPQPFPVWTPIPTRTPGVVTATPLILIPTMTASPTSNVPLTFTSTVESPTVTNTAVIGPVTETFAPPSTPFTAVQVDVLGCNTGLDVTHGMGEVTNAYVVLKNTGTVDLPNGCALLRAADEDRVHPDKSKCVDMLPSGYQVTLKLTVDSTYKVDTVIQVDASSNSTLLLRVDRPSCTDIDLSAGGAPLDVGVVKPITP
ncbi:MAG TPA: hypothetical protein VIV15_17055 [Anaerolineales bacterium]